MIRRAKAVWRGTGHAGNGHLHCHRIEHRGGPAPAQQWAGLGNGAEQALLSTSIEPVRLCGVK
jgi:hypothetical protein